MVVVVVQYINANMKMQDKKRKKRKRNQNNKLHAILKVKFFLFKITNDDNVNIYVSS